MISLPHLLLLGVDALLIGMGAWLLVRLFADELPSALEQLLAWGLAAMGLIAGAGILLGMTGGLGRFGFLWVHLVVLVAVAGVRRAAWRDDFRAWRALVDWRARFLAPSRAETFLRVLLLLVVALLFGLALAAEPVVFDALTYRLSRIGHWLQEGRVVMIGGDDARLNYMPVVPDLVMAWLLGGSASGFGMVALAQTFGGLLALGATVGLARLMGVGRLPALAAGGLVLGLPNVAPQFTAAYTDLFTAGVLAAGFYLWLAALRRGHGSRWGGVAAGLALGSKGTIFYFAPGLLLAVGWLAWRHRAGANHWRRTLLAAALAVTVFALPAMIRNVRVYGGPAGPEDFVRLHHGENPGVAGSVEKLRLNLASSFVQLLEPNSQFPGWSGLTRSLGETVLRTLPKEDPYAFQGLDRHANLEKIYGVAAPDADVTSTGILLPLLALAATVAAWMRRKTADGQLALVWSVALGAFVLFLCWRVQWHPYLFRFFGLAAPWLAALAVWWLQLLPGQARAIAWIVTLAATCTGLSGALFKTYQSGWPAVVRPAQSTGFHVYQNWRAWTAALDRPDEVLRPALDVNSPLAAFYRQASPRRILPEKLSTLPAGTAQACVRPGEGWVIVPVAQFLGHEGRVMGRTWLFEGDERHPYSVAAWRALGPGEKPVPLLYRNRVVAAGPKERRELLIRGWDNKPVPLAVGNRGSAAVHCTVWTPLGVVETDVGPGAEVVFEVQLPASGLTPAAIEFPAGARLEARLLP